MALILSNGVRYTLQATWSPTSRPVHTVWHAIVVTTNRTAGIYEAAGAIGSAWAMHIVPLLPNNYTLDSVGYLDLSSETGSSGEFVLTPGAGGGVAGSSAPPNIGVQITKAITNKGRGRKSGRVFLPGGIFTNVTESGTINQAALDGLEDGMQAFHNAVNGYNGPEVASMRLVVAHTPFVEVEETIRHKVPAKDGQMTSSDISGYTAKPINTGIQRRVQTG